jgi:putative transposase
MQGYKRIGVAIAKLLQWASLPSSTYYYKSSGKPRGCRPSTYTVTMGGEHKPNHEVVEQIEAVLRQEFCCYGYRMMTAELTERNFIINHKKVYRLMKEHHLLYNGRIRVQGPPRSFVRYRIIPAQKPLEYLSMDIKYVYLHGQGRNALLLTVLDVYSRRVLMHMLRLSIKKGDVLVLLSLLLLEYQPQGLTLRSDNGSQFIATAVRQFLKDKGVYQEFTHVATPQDNSYIEALHSSLQREVIDRFEFESLYHAQLVIDRYYRWYNEKRRHWALNQGTPQSRWNDYFNPLPEKTKYLPYGSKTINDRLHCEEKTLQKIRG